MPKRAKRHEFVFRYDAAKWRQFKALCEAEGRTINGALARMLDAELARAKELKGEIPDWRVPPGSKALDSSGSRT